MRLSDARRHLTAATRGLAALGRRVAASWPTVRRFAVGAVGWTLVGTGLAAILLPIPIELPVLLAGAALVGETNPAVQRWLDGFIGAVRRRTAELQHATVTQVQGALDGVRVETLSWGTAAVRRLPSRFVGRNGDHVLMASA